MSMQMDAYLKKERIGNWYPFCPGGGTGRGISGGGGGAGGLSPKIVRAYAKNMFWRLLCT